MSASFIPIILGKGKDSRNWATAHFLVFDGWPWNCLGASGCVISLLIEDQGLDLSAILVPFDSNPFMLCPWAMSFFQKLFL